MVFAWINLGTPADGSYYEDVQYMSELKTSNKGRVITQVALDGDDAADDTAQHIYASGYYLGTIWNTGTDGSLDGQSFKKIYGFVPPNADIQLLCESTSADAAYLGIMIVTGKQIVPR